MSEANKRIYLDWRQDDDESIRARSVFHDAGDSLDYVVQYIPANGDWIATFEGGIVAQGGLAFCLSECEERDNEAVRLHYSPAAREERNESSCCCVPNHGRKDVQREILPDFGMVRRRTGVPTANAASREEWMRDCGG